MTLIKLCNLYTNIIIRAQDKNKNGESDIKEVQNTSQNRIKTPSSNTDSTTSAQDGVKNCPKCQSGNTVATTSYGDEPKQRFCGNCLELYDIEGDGVKASPDRR